MERTAMGHRLRRWNAARFGIGALLAALFATGLYAQTDIIVPGGGPYWTLARNVAWGQAGLNGLHNYYILTPRESATGVCVTLESQNPTETHTLSVLAYVAYDPNVFSYVANVSKWRASLALEATDAYTWASGGAQAVPALSARRWWFHVGGAARIAIYPWSSTAGSASPDTVSVFAAVSPEPCVAVRSSISNSASAVAGNADIAVPQAIGGRALIDSITAWCSAGTATVSVTQGAGALTVWATPAGEINTALFGVAWPQGLPLWQFLDESAVLRLSTCGAGNTGTIYATYRWLWR